MELQEADNLRMPVDGCPSDQVGLQLQSAEETTAPTSTSVPVPVPDGQIAEIGDKAPPSDETAEMHSDETHKNDAQIAQQVQVQEQENGDKNVEAGKASAALIADPERKRGPLLTGRLSNSSNSSSSSIMAEFNKIARQIPNRSTSLRTPLNSNSNSNANSTSSFSVFGRTARPAKLQAAVPVEQVASNIPSPDGDSCASVQLIEAPEVVSATATVAGNSFTRRDCNQAKALDSGDAEKAGGDSFETGFRYRQNEPLNRYSARGYGNCLSSRRYYDFYKRDRLAYQSQSMPALSKDLSKSTLSFSELEQAENGSPSRCTETEEEKKECCEPNGEQEESDKQSLTQEQSANESNNTNDALKLTKRYHIIAELVSVERDYVDSLKVINNKYLPALRSAEFWDSNLAVDKMFSGIAQIARHHEGLMSDLQVLWENYNENQTVGDMFIATFRRQEIVDTYCNFIEHFDNAARFLDVSLLSKPAFVKFEEEFRKETGVKLPLMALLIKPAQRIPRYELLLKRLADHTDQSHADSQMLTEAIEVVHKVAVNINDVQVAQDKRVVTLKQLEDFLGVDLAVADRNYLRHDIVQLQSVQPEKSLDCCHLFLFTDILVLAAPKKKANVSSKNNANAMLYFAGGGHEFMEPANRFKVITQSPLTDVNIIPDIAAMSRRKTVNPNDALVQLQTDRTIVEQLMEQAAKVSMPHQALDDALRDLQNSLNAKVGRAKMEVARDKKVVATSSSSSKVTLCTGSDQKLYDLAFQNAERKIAWEKAFSEAKSHLNKTTDL